MNDKMKNNKIILDLCGGSGSWSYFYKQLGYDVRLITLPEYDVANYSCAESVHGVLAAPPCTEFSIVRNHNIKKDTEYALSIVNHCLRIIKECNPTFWALENPIGKLSKYIGNPVYSFHPWWFGDPWTKYTHLWGKFNIPERVNYSWEDMPKNHNLYIRPGRNRPSMACQHLSHKSIIPQLSHLDADSDASFRALTPPGFAKSFTVAND